MPSGSRAHIADAPGIRVTEQEPVILEACLPQGPEQLLAFEDRQALGAVGSVQAGSGANGNAQRLSDTEGHGGCCQPDAEAACT